MAEIRASTGLGDRRRGREIALQLLFQLDLSPGEPEAAVEAFFKGRTPRPGVRAFAERLVLGAFGRREWIDSLLAGVSHHWRVARMAAVDRNLLRLAIYEMLYETETPPVVVINEAIEIAKRFGNDESGPFINGILDAVRMRHEGGAIDLPEEGGARRVPAGS